MYVFLAVVLIPSICNGLGRDGCDVLPKDLFIEEGSDATATCHTSCGRGKVYWTLDSRVVNETLSKVINASQTVITLRNLSIHRSTLQCHRENTQVILGGTTVITYSKPNNVSCILHYKNQETKGVPELFTCNWEHQVYSPQRIKYTVLCDSCSPKSEICTSQEKTCTNNYANHLSDIMPLIRIVNITVRAKWDKWETSSEPFVLDLLTRIKMTTPKLNVAAISDHLLVEWKITLNEELFDCQVKYSKTVNEGKREWELSKTVPCEKEKGNIMIENVESCSNYTVAVRCALKSALWSDWSQEKTVVTNLKGKDVKLSLWRSVAEADENGVRKVRAMWKGIPSTCPGTFNYTIKLQKDSPQKTQDPSAVCDNTTCEVDVNGDSQIVKLTVHHNGFLLVNGSVYVPAIGESLPQVTDMQTTTLEGVILVTWTPPVEPVSGYMIDYTHNGNQHYWKETKYTNATLSDLLDKKTYNITVTPLFDNKTGRGTQALQICSRVEGPGNITILDVKAKDRSAIVSWDVKSQDKCSGVVVNYTIFYSPQDGPQLNVTVNGTRRDVLLTDLNPKTDYSLYIKATALTGHTSSSVRHFKTKRFDPMIITALSVCGGILIVLVLALGLCCAVQWRKFKEKLVPNPGKSSVALWPSTSCEQGTRPVQLFHPSVSPCDMVYTEEAQRASTSEATGSNHNTTCDRTMVYTAILTAPDEEIEDPFDSLGTQQPSSPGETGESAELLPSYKSQFSPYQSQSPVETPTPKPNQQSKRVPIKQQERTPPLTVYVTLDMFKQGQRR